MTHLRRKQTEIEGFQHDGSDVRAFAIAHWINANGGKARAYNQGEYQAYPDQAVVRILDERVAVNLIVAGSWAINLGDKNFIGIPDNVIKMAYDVIDQESATFEEPKEQPGGYY